MRYWIKWQHYHWHSQSFYWRFKEFSTSKARRKFKQRIKKQFISQDSIQTWEVK